jgi:GT2 family glycosyltransferase
MPEAPFFSIIIPNWNGARHLPTCLDALRRQTYRAFEVILVDNGSTDESLALVKRDYPEVQVLRLPRNRGLTGACNAGAALARGDVLVMLNNDTEADPGWLEALAATLRAHPDAGAVASKLLLFDRRDVLHSAGDFYGIDGIPGNRGVWQQDQGQYDDQVEVFGACGGAAAYRRAAWEEAGGFDEGFFMYCEDVDLAWRLRLLGWRAVFAPAARVYHRLSATGGGPIASFYTGRNTLWVLLKDVPGPLLRRYAGRMLRAQARIAWEALRAWRGPAARARLRGQCAAILGLPRLLRQRRAVQASRRVGVEELDKILTR